MASKDPIGVSDKLVLSWVEHRYSCKECSRWFENDLKRNGGYKGRGTPKEEIEIGAKIMSCTVTRIEELVKAGKVSQAESLRRAYFG